MLDINFIRNKQELVERSAREKRYKVDVAAVLLFPNALVVNFFPLLDEGHDVLRLIYPEVNGVSAALLGIPQNGRRNL